GRKAIRVAESAVPAVPRSSTPTYALSAGDAVLGLLIEQPSNSYQLERRLETRFGAAQFAHGTAYQAVKRLSAQGLIRPVVQLTPADPRLPRPGSLPATSYEPTPHGVDYFRRWLRASTSMPPVREELLAKIAFCGPSDLPRMVEIVRDAELACTAQLNDLNQRMRLQQRLADGDPWRSLMGLIVSAGDVAWWDSRIKWLQELRRYLQREGQRYHAASRPSPGDPLT
ncbi:MAG: helix-turn-helix transcriptional regulator, partial [Solirubrobacteraceae bacterium]